MASPVPPKEPLNPSDYHQLEPDEIAFFKSQTGIQDDVELQEHILKIQAEAYEVYAYSCIRRFMFAMYVVLSSGYRSGKTTVIRRLKISRYPAYKAALEIGQERPDAILLDLGCCLGNDARKAIADGFPIDRVVASDLRPEYWELGHKLFRSSRESFPVPFLPGNIMDPAFLSPDTPVLPTSSVSPSPVPNLLKLKSLTELQHHVSVIHISSVFHLFPERQQPTLAYLLGTLLSPLPGSVIFGSQGGMPDTEENDAGSVRLTGRGTEAFMHSSTSFTKMWVGKGGVFRPEDVNIQVIFTGEGGDQIDCDPLHKVLADRLVWSITRV